MNSRGASSLGILLALVAITLPGTTFGGDPGPVRNHPDARQCLSLTFDNDVPGQPPQIGGPGQLNQLRVPPGTTILVQSAAHGITTQPLVVTTSAPNQFASAGASFTAAPSGVVRVEATVALDRLVDALFLQTGVSINGAVVTRLIVLSDGTVRDDISQTILGTYAANQPFRVREDIDMTADRWSVALDDELNGFEDDPVTTNLPFENASSVLPHVAAVIAALSVFPVMPTGGASIAYDDILVQCPDMSTPSNGETWGRVKTWYR